jgi:hypothetical protein
LIIATEILSRKNCSKNFPEKKVPQFSSRKFLLRELERAIRSSGLLRRSLPHGRPGSALLRVFAEEACGMGAHFTARDSTILSRKMIMPSSNIEKQTGKTTYVIANCFFTDSDQGSLSLSLTLSLSLFLALFLSLSLYL